MRKRYLIAALAIISLALILQPRRQAFVGVANATGPTPTPTPYPMPTPAAEYGAPTNFSRVFTESSKQLGNCQQFPDTAGHIVYNVTAYSTDASAQYFQVYDQAAAPPTTPEVWPACKALADPQGRCVFNFLPGLYFKNGVLVCNSTNSDPTQYTPGALDSMFGAAFD